MPRETSPRRNFRSKGFKVKHAVQIIALIGICIWLVYPVKPSSEEIIKLGRKDIGMRGKGTTFGDQEQKEDKQEENQHVLQDSKPQGDESEGKQGGDDAMLNHSREESGVEGGDGSKPPGSEKETQGTNENEGQREVIEPRVKMESKEESGELPSDSLNTIDAAISDKQNEGNNTAAGRKNNFVSLITNLNENVVQNMESNTNHAVEAEGRSATSPTSANEYGRSPSASPGIEAREDAYRNQSANPGTDAGEKGTISNGSEKDQSVNPRTEAGETDTTSNRTENAYGNKGEPAMEAQGNDTSSNKTENADVIRGVSSANPEKEAAEKDTNSNESESSYQKQSEPNSNPGAEVGDNDATPKGTENADINQSQSSSNPGAEATEKDANSSGSENLYGNQSEPTSPSISPKPQDEKEASSKVNEDGNSTTSDAAEKDASSRGSEKLHENQSEPTNPSISPKPQDEKGAVNEDGNSITNDSAEKDANSRGSENLYGNQSEPTSPISPKPQDEKEASLKVNEDDNRTTHEPIDSSDSSIRHEETNAPMDPGSGAGEKGEGTTNDAAAAE